jgi:hypothetical protein
MTCDVSRSNKMKTHGILKMQQDDDTWQVVRWLSVPLLSVLWSDYIWKYICYRWKKNASVFLDVESRL